MVASADAAQTLTLEPLAETLQEAPVVPEDTAAGPQAAAAVVPQPAEAVGPQAEAEPGAVPPDADLECRGICCKCQQHVELDRLVLFSVAQESMMICKECQALVRMTHRAWGTQCLRNMTPEEQADFFKSCHQTKFGSRFKSGGVRVQL